MTTREFDILLLGATGYTGKLTAEFITKSVTDQIKWAMAGRSESKLNDLANKLQALDSSISAPSNVIVSDLSVPEISKIAKRTRILVNCIGPYHKYSTPVVQACVETGTHYLDVTGETPWIREIISKFQDTAKKNKVVLIPSVGVESAPSDLVAFNAVRLIREVWDCGVMDVVSAVHEFKSSGASGGTLASAFGIFDHYGTSELRESSNPFILSPVMSRDHRHTKYPAPTTYRRSILEKVTGVWAYPLLGKLTTSITGKPNEAIVHRSAGHYPEYYGFNFNYAEYMSVGSTPVGILIHFALMVMVLCLAFAPTRAIAALFMKYKPGDGPTVEQGKKDRFEIRAVAVAEQLSKVPRKAFSTFAFEGTMYELSARLLAIGAISLLKDQDRVVKTHGYGFLTPSTLGSAYIDRLNKVDVKIQVKQLGDNGSK